MQSIVRNGPTSKSVGREPEDNSARALGRQRDLRPVLRLVPG